MHWLFLIDRKWLFLFDSTWLIQPDANNNPAQTVRNGFNDICIPVSSNKAIIFRIKDKVAPLISKDMPENGVINLSLNSVIAYNCMQLAMGQKFLFGTSNTIKYMKKLWEARSASRNKRK